MASTLSRMHALQDLALRRQNNNPPNFPTLFHLAIQSCISHLQIFATLDGLPFHPFGQALFQEFVHRSTQWRLTTEQRQVGIILFAETYGEDDNAALGPEYTGLRCSLAQDISYLGSFADSLVYLDLSGGAGTNGGDRDNADPIGFTDKDMAGLSGLSRLRVLNLQGLKVGDTGVSHLIRSVTFGSSGPAGLEYLNLSGTDVTDVGISRLFGNVSGQRERGTRHLVFKRLLGIDLTDSKVHQEVALTLFRENPSSTSSSCGWRRLEDKMILFPTLTTKEQSAAKDKDSKECYLEIESDKNPVQKWVDRLNRTYKLSFGQRPDLAGDDGLGISECLALAKLSQIYLHPLSDPVAEYQQEYTRRGEEYRVDTLMKRAKRRKDKRYIKDLEDTLRAIMKGKTGGSQQQQSQTELEHMYNLAMYQKVLTSVRSTFGTRSVSSKKPAVTVPGKHIRLAFVRNRAEVEELLDRLELEDIIPRHSHQQEQVVSEAKDTTGVIKAKIRDRYHRPMAASGILKPPPLLSPPSHTSLKFSHDQYLARPEPSSSFGSYPFVKRSKAAATSSIFIKQEPPTQPFDSHLPGKRRTHGGANALQPFVKPVAEQTPNSIFFTPVPLKEEKQYPQAKTTSAPPIRSKLKSSPTTTMMDRWVKKTLSADTSTTPSGLSHLPGKKHRGSSNTTSGITSRESNVVREFYFTDESNDTISLDRWIRSGPTARNGKISTSDSEGPPRKVIRFDPRSELFADKDSA